MDSSILLFKDLTKKFVSEKVVANKEEIKNQIRDIKIQDRVYHKSFGQGRVYKIEKDIISIDFFGEIKKFPFPGVFVEGYIEFLD